ncbi:hypothetical protein PsorP6_000830 [Peronosclerospora sorghi]|uniref:Uncharacterized protein n=1 Tax=Peronosclerospora sorghi TaxID=230839 RepID=A0ACC0WXX0_9STRA|nr:hypothetical protein PsorP6_000830 [Peronosclerospora sorghi]
MVLEALQDAEYDTADDARDDIASFAESEGYTVKVGSQELLETEKEAISKTLSCCVSMEESTRLKENKFATVPQSVLVARLKFVSNEMECNTQIRAIYNVKQKMILETLNGRSPLEALLNGLVERGITHQALEQCQRALALTETTITECAELFSKKMGIPCAHNLKRLLDTGEKLKREDFDQNWWLVQPTREPLSSTPQPTPTIDESLQNILEAHADMGPNQQRLLEQTMASFNVEGAARITDADIIRTGGRPSNAQNAPASGFQNSSRRDPSTFERDELEAGMESQSWSQRKRKCGECNEEGHNQKNVL